MKILKKYFGPSTIIAAAFIGPGTVTTCSIAGVQSAYSLIWALVFSTSATIVLQEMAARLGFVSQQGLPEAIHKTIKAPLSKNLIFVLIFSSVIIGNAAYEAGNISGASLGMELIWDKWSYWPLLIAGFTFVLLWWGRYRWIERSLIVLVILMTVCFLITAFMVWPDWNSLWKGFIPSAFDRNELLLVLGLIGTTVVPYNLFLHASIVGTKWPANSDINDIRAENRVSIILGGAISILIVIVAAGSRAQVSEINSASDLAIQLEPFLGVYAKYLMGFGLLAAGLSSTITAALAAAYVARGIFRFSSSDQSMAFRSVWIFILIVASLVSMMQIDTIIIIKFAQITNAFVLPVLACFLLYLCNSDIVMAGHTNTKYENIAGLFVIGVTFVLGIRTLFLVFG